MWKNNNKIIHKTGESITFRTFTYLFLNEFISLLQKEASQQHLSIFSSFFWINVLIGLSTLRFIFPPSAVVFLLVCLELLYYLLTQFKKSLWTNVLTFDSRVPWYTDKFRVVFMYYCVSHTCKCFNIIHTRTHKNWELKSTNS